jgi:hypothetical protein
LFFDLNHAALAHRRLSLGVITSVILILVAMWERILRNPVADLPSLDGDPKNTLASVCCPAIPGETLRR